MPVIYKVVETAQVDDITLEQIVNDTCAVGWQFEGFHFAMRDNSRRPSMAFVMFSRPLDDVDGGRDAGGVADGR